MLVSALVFALVVLSSVVYVETQKKNAQTVADSSAIAAAEKFRNGIPACDVAREIAEAEFFEVTDCTITAGIADVTVSREVHLIIGVNGVVTRSAKAGALCDNSD
jgi:secretion/DNA translocation related TadE-like protein